MSKRVTITFTDKQSELIENISIKRNTSFADVVRELCDEALKIQANTDNIDMITEILDERLRSILKPQVERIVAIAVKGAIMSSTSTFLNAQALVDLVPQDKRREFNDIYEKARLKGIAYVKNRYSENNEEFRESSE